MRILQVCNKPPYPPRDGGSIAMFSLARSLCRLGHQVTVLTMFTKKHRLTAGQKQEFAKFMDIHSIYVDTSPRWLGLLSNLLFSDKPYHVQRFISKEFEAKLCHMLKAGKFDVVQLEGLYLTPYIAAIRQNSQALIVLRAHNVEHEIWDRIADSEKNIFKKAYLHRLASRISHFEKQVLNKYDLLVPITSRDLNHFNSMGNVKPAHVCPAGIDMETEPGSPENNPRNKGSAMSTTCSLFFIGSLDWIPNQEGLLWFLANVYPLMHRKFPTVKLHVAGRNAPSSLIKKLHLPGVIFHGEVADAREFAKAHHIFIVPCFSGSGMRLKIIEAMAFGRPVVTTPIGAEGLNVKHDENILIADNAIDFCEQVERLMNNPELYLKITQNAISFLQENYININLAATLAGFYETQLK